MHDLILHHYDEAPFAEKIRLVFGIKGLTWRSVIVPSAMPKPDLMPLTGGYRRTPVLQIGADVYCDPNSPPCSRSAIRTHRFSRTGIQAWAWLWGVGQTGRTS